MRRLPMPTESPEVVFKTCISRVRDQILKRRLETCIPEVIVDSQDFNQHVVNNTLHRIAEKEYVGDNVSKAEMEKVYTQRMVPKSSPGRIFYDKLITAPKLGICPLCGQRFVQTLDHHLPKAHHPSLVVTPTNLIPSCSDCNFKKTNFQPTSPDEEPLHPYFDDIESDQWLFAKLIEGNPVTFQFYVEPPSHWNRVLVNRVEKHFETFDLARLYSIQAATELSDIKYQLEELHRSAGSEAVKSQLIDRAESCKKNQLNYWKTAMYFALADSTWFHNTGVLL